MESVHWVTLSKILLIDILEIPLQEKTGNFIPNPFMQRWSDNYHLSKQYFGLFEFNLN